MQIQLEAIELKGRWFVKPAGQMGTCGFYPTAWSLFAATRCRTAEQAIAQCRREAHWALNQVLPTILGAIDVRVGEFKGNYHNAEIDWLVKRLIKSGKKPGPYGLYWVYDGDCDFEECNFAFAGDAQRRSWGGTTGLRDMIEEYKKEALLCKYVW